MWAISQEHVLRILASSRTFYQLIQIMLSRELRNSQMTNVPRNYYSRSRVRNHAGFVHNIRSDSPIDRVPDKLDLRIINCCNIVLIIIFDLNFTP